MEIKEVTPVELNAELVGEFPPVLLDVREANELAISVLPNVVHIPMGEVRDRFGELDPNLDTVVVCRAGVRSAKIVAFLIAQGFRSVRNLATGMNGWAETVDPSLETY